MLSRFVVPVVLSLLLAACGTSRVVDSGGVEAVQVDSAAAADWISRHRAMHNLGPVIVDTRLTRAAEHQAHANARAGELSHSAGGEFSSRLSAVGFDRRYAAENLGAGATSLDEALLRWKDSPAHNKNMLMPEVQRIGIARVAAPGTRYRHFWALVLSSS